MGEALKRCTKCGEEKAATAEHFQRRGAGFRGVCEPCRLQQGFNAIKNTHASSKTCRICSAVYPATPEFFKSSYRYVSNYCLKCHEEREGAKAKGLRQCSKCKKMLPGNEEFFSSYRTKKGDVLKAICRECQGILKKTYREENAEAERETRKKYAAENKDLLRQKNREYRERRSAEDPEWARRYSGTPQRREYARRYYWKDPEKRRKVARDWAARNPEKAAATTQNRRAILKNCEGEIQSSDIRKLYLEQKGRCHYCGERIGKGKGKLPAHVDHVVPISRGGSNTADNIVLACQGCNLSKGPKLLHEWMPDRFSPPDTQATD